MQYEACDHDSSHYGVTFKEAHEEFAMEVCENLLQHDPGIFKGGVGKEYPCQTNHMEGDEYGEELTNAV